MVVLTVMCTGTGGFERRRWKPEDSLDHGGDYFDGLEWKMRWVSILHTPHISTCFSTRQKSRLESPVFSEKLTRLRAPAPLSVLAKR